MWISEEKKPRKEDKEKIKLILNIGHSYAQCTLFLPLAHNLKFIQIHTNIVCRMLLWFPLYTCIFVGGKLCLTCTNIVWHLLSDFQICDKSGNFIFAFLLHDIVLIFFNWMIEVHIYYYCYVLKSTHSKISRFRL